MEEDTIAPYIEQLVPKLIRVVDKNEITIRAKIHALLAISSCASVSRTKFADLSRELIPLLGHLIEIKDDQYIDLKSHSIQCIASILGNCVKANKDIFENQITPLIKPIYESLK
mmetsp:Transcript_35850/g.32246  ORF Transcript_35850/g.32246 Transcript_35850/m.32246 type:complete len:114 (-) Transcript_35850:378-719(-)